MHQIDHKTAASVLPEMKASGKPGFFTDGDPVKGQPATVLPAEFMNMLMLEFINVLKAADIQPDKSKLNQVAESIKALGYAELKEHLEQENPHTQYRLLSSFNNQTFTSSGTFIVPEGVTAIYVTGCAAGGGGGGGGRTWDASKSSAGGGGGGAGESVFKREIIVTPGETIQISIGAGGVGGAGSANNTNENVGGGQGGSGGDTIIISKTATITLKGGRGAAGGFNQSPGGGAGGGAGQSGGQSGSDGHYSLPIPSGNGGCGGSSPFGTAGGGGRTGIGGGAGASLAAGYGAGGGGGGGMYATNSTPSRGGNGSAGTGGIIFIEY